MSKNRSLLRILFSRAALPVAILSVLLMFANAGAGQGERSQSSQVTVGRSYHNDTSPPLRDMKQLPIKPHLIDDKDGVEANRNPANPTDPDHIDATDSVVQSFLAPDAMPATIRNMDGILYPGVACNCAPPDTDGDVGATQYVQMVNNGYQVFNKSTGASVLGPSAIATIWSGFGGVCQTTGNGDPVVLYDQLAGRWLISQFAGSTGDRKSTRLNSSHVS